MNPYQVHGAISWSELQTTDLEAATTFYEAVFGWKTEKAEMAMGPYHVVSAAGVNAGGLMNRVVEEVPPHWAHYITVADINETAARAKELGATIVVGPESAGEVGHFCGIQDPQGAFVYLLEYSTPDEAPDFATGFRRHGAFSWFEQRSADPEASVAFYTKLFGWTSKAEEMQMGTYHQISVGEVGIGGITSLPEEGVPPHWGGYVTVDSAEEAAARVSENGGTVLGMFDVPTVGTIGVFQDPQGATLSFCEYLPHDPESLEVVSEAEAE